MSRIIVGIDPGKTGAVCVLDSTDQQAAAIVRKMPSDAASLVELLESVNIWRVIVEKVSAGGVANAEGRRMGASSAFTFGRGFGEILGILAAMKLPHALVTPQKWTNAMSLRGKSKDDHAALARQLHPIAGLYRRNEPVLAMIPKYAADAVLIAEYGRRHLWPDATL